MSKLETETDSDPIVESDTTEHSGDDDGVSWPSDREELAAGEISREGVEISEDNPTSEQKPINQPVPPKNAQNGEILRKHENA